MSGLIARMLATFRDGENGGYSSCYGLVVSVATTLLFCALAATVGVWKAFVFGGLALAAFGVAGCLAPESWCLGRRGGAGAGAEQEAMAAVAADELRSGLAEAAINALPTFAYASRAGAEDGGDLESGTGGDELCSVCLEDMKAGEMVRRLPACGHLFHVECIDMWLHSHRTCPLCRCDLSPPRKVAAKLAAPEAEPPADDALLPV